MRILRLAIVTAIIVLAVQSANAVYELVIIEKPFYARSLKGIVLDPSGARLAGADVKDYDPQFSTVVASTTTDANGRFSLHSRGQSVHHLRFYARGMNPLQVTVILRASVKSGIEVTLPIGG